MKHAKNSEILEEIARLIDIPEHLAEEAVLRYEGVAAWLAEEGSPLAVYSPEIYPQGSFRLGTPIRPLRDGEEFDIDLVCKLEMVKEATTQENLKTLVGDRLRANREYDDALVEQRRCWTIEYSKKFHLDVLPSIPDLEVGDPTILLTDKKLRNWQHSNPIGYADWFYSRMKEVFDERRLAIALSAEVDIEEVPTWRVRTTLQRSVQLLKRHRDLVFEPDDENRPVSIIVTTLAGHAYNQDRDLFRALVHIVREMRNYVQRRNGKWWVENPAHPKENFADKWNEEPARKDAFYAWLDRLERELSDVASLVRRLSSVNATRPTSVVAPAVPLLGDAAHAAAPRWACSDQYRCKVRGWVYPGYRKGRHQWQLRKGRVPKNVGLKFEATTNAPKPYDIKWQVVNTGKEARAEGALRGGFYDSDAPAGARWERTEYAGTHWVEAFVIKGDRCVARSGRKLVRIS